MTQIIWNNLITLIADRIGFKIRPQDINFFKIKIEKRIKKLNLSTLQEYYYLLKNADNKKEEQNSLGKKEWKILANIITNGESFFFRDRGQIDLIANTILPKIIAEKIKAKKRGESSFLSLKVWSAGCSTGEEVYSLAMVISELIADPAQWNITIIGTDINQDFLELARKGIYKQWSFRLTEPLFRTKYFIAQEQNWQVKPHIKTMVSFYQDNLIDVDRISHHNYSLDLVICRNVFIYFDLDSIAKAVQKIANTLRYGGYFMSGHAELQGIKLKDFQPISFPESIVYQYVPKAELNNFSLSDSLNLPNNNIRQNILLESFELPLFSQNTSQPTIEKPNIDLPKKNPEKKQITAAKNSDYSTAIDEIKILLYEGKYDVIINKEKELINSFKCKKIYYLIARTYGNKGDIEKAKINCDRSLEIDYTYTAPLFLLAQIAEAQDNYSKAKELLKRIIYLEPSSIAAHLDLGDIYNKENQLNRSKKMYQTAYDILKQYPPQKSIEEANIGFSISEVYATKASSLEHSFAKAERLHRFLKRDTVEQQEKKSVSDLLNYIEHKLQKI